MLFENKEDKDKDDYFDNENQSEQESGKENRPKYKPEDPEYWEEENSEWEHLRPKRTMRVPFWLWIAGAAVVIGLIIGCWLRYFSPYVEEATQYGYVESLEKRGTVFKTYEGTLIPYKELMDTTRLYSRDFIFSVEGAKTAATLKQAQLNARPIRVTYKKYHAIVPWRGASKTVVTDADTVNPDKILPPEFAPKR